MTKNTGTFVLERALSKLGLASRSQTRGWILEGRLKVNGKTVKNPLYLVDPGIDKIALDGKRVQRESWKTIMLYKPRSVVTTRLDEHGRRTIFDLLPDELKSLHPVGRLDMATTGLLLLTNDTSYSAYMTDPGNAIRRTYLVSVKGKVSGEEVQELIRGIWDQGEFLKPVTLILRKSSNKESHVTLELTEGKNREIRRMFESIGHEVTQLKRVAFGSLTLGDMQPGQFRYLTPAEINKSVT
jgi:23S rRNA pseudouridine2605 synthase